MLFCVLRYLPCTHASHCTSAGYAARTVVGVNPALHTQRSATAVVALELCAGHGLQPVGAFAVTFLYLSSSQRVQGSCGGRPYSPGGHAAVQFAKCPLPAAEDCPRGHALHAKIVFAAIVSK